MKKSLVCVLVLCGSLFAGIDDKIKDLVKDSANKYVDKQLTKAKDRIENKLNGNIERELNNLLKGTNSKILNQYILQTNQNLMLLEILNEKNAVEYYVATSDGTVIFNNFIAKQEIQNEIAQIVYQSKKNNFILSEQDQRLINIISKIPNEMAIRLESDNKKSDIIEFILTDPNCPYCQDDLKQIEQKLKTHHIIMIFTPVKGKNSLEKSAYILNNFSSKKTRDEQIKLLKTTFFDNKNTYNLKDKKITTDDVARVKELIFNAAQIKYVPYSVNIKIKEQ